MKNNNEIIINGIKGSIFFYPNEDSINPFSVNGREDDKNLAGFASFIEPLGGNVRLHTDKAWQHAEKKRPFQENIKLKGIHEPLYSCFGQLNGCFEYLYASLDYLNTCYGQLNGSHGEVFAAHVKMFVAHENVFACFFRHFDGFRDHFKGYNSLITAY
jgi:hypothetical protein